MANKATAFIDYFTKDYRRAIVIGVFLIVIIILLVVFWSRIKSLFQILGNKLQNKQLENEWTAQTGETATLSYANLQSMANKLFQAADGAGTDEDAIFAVFNQLHNTADLYALISAYGTRNGLDLPGMIRDELGDHFPTYERTKLNKILTNKGIAYQF